jgi:hypothetical protein
VFKIAAWTLYDQHIDASVVLAENERGPVLPEALITTSGPIQITQNTLTLSNLKFNSWDKIKGSDPKIGENTIFKFRFYIARQILFSNPFRFHFHEQESENTNKRKR